MNSGRTACSRIARKRSKCCSRLGPGGDDEHLAARHSEPNNSATSRIGLHQRQTGLQALDDLRRLRVELTVVERQVGFADQAIADLGIEVIRQHQLGRQGKKRQLDFRQIAGVQQLDPRIAEPRLLIEQLQHQRKHRAVENVHVQTLKPGALQQLHLQIAEPGAVDMHHRAVDRQAVGLKLASRVRSWRLVN